ncbi:STAS domain-containing protein [Aquicoccus sp. SCR17]|nr:STAS domain-containing protein [Carideicomes alvinocaridis]
MQLAGTVRGTTQVITVMAPRIDAAVAIRFKDLMREETERWREGGAPGAEIPSASGPAPAETGAAPGTTTGIAAGAGGGAMAQGPPPRVVLDLGRVEFVDSSGLGAIVAAMKQLEEGRRLELAGLAPLVDRVFRLTRLDTVFRIHRDLEEAMQRDIPE